MTSNFSSTVDLLILGAGWTSKFLIPLCESLDVTYAATTRHEVHLTGTATNNKLVFFDFDFNSEDPTPFEILPLAKTVLITFPIRVKGASVKLVRFYEGTHEGAKGTTRFIQLGSTDIWDVRICTFS